MVDGLSQELTSSREFSVIHRWALSKKIDIDSLVNNFSDDPNHSVIFHRILEERGSLPRSLNSEREKYFLIRCIKICSENGLDTYEEIEPIALGTAFIIECWKSN